MSISDMELRALAGMIEMADRVVLIAYNDVTGANSEVELDPEEQQAIGQACRQAVLRSIGKPADASTSGAH